MNEKRSPKKSRLSAREAALAGAAVVGLGVAAGVALEHKPKSEPTQDTAGEELRSSEKSQKHDSGEKATKLDHQREQVTFRDDVALRFVENLPEGYRVNPEADTITITTELGKEMGQVYVDPDTHELTFQAPQWASSDLDALGDFEIEHFTFKNPEEIKGLADDMQKIAGWVDEYAEFRQAASEDLFGNIGSTNYAEDVASSNKAIEAEQTELVQKVQDESTSLHLKIH